MSNFRYAIIISALITMLGITASPAYSQGADNVDSASSLDSIVKKSLDSAHVDLGFSCELPDGVDINLHSEASNAVKIAILPQQAVKHGTISLTFKNVGAVGRFWGENVLSGSAKSMAAQDFDITGPLAVQDASRAAGIVVRAVDASGSLQKISVSYSSEGLKVEISAQKGSFIIISTFMGDLTLAMERSATADGFDTGEAKAGIASDVNSGEDYNVSKALASQGRRMSGYIAAAETDWLFFADQDRVFRPLLADQREAQTRAVAGKFFGKDEYYDNPFEVSFGGDLVLLRRKFLPAEQMSVSIRGAIASRFDIGGKEPGEGNFPLLNTDFFGGVALAWQKENDTFELYGYHQSAHLGDETVLLSNYDTPWENYSREALRFLWSRDIGDLRVYGGGTFNATSDNNDLECKLGLQAGSEYRFDLFDQPFYAAADLQAWQYHDFRPNLNTQIGWFYDKPEENPMNVRIFLEYFVGHSNMGHFWEQNEQTVTLGAGMNF